MRYMKCIAPLCLLTLVNMQALAAQEEHRTKPNFENIRDPFSLLRAKQDAPWHPVRADEEDDAEALLVETARSRAETAFKSGQLAEALAQCGKGLNLLAGFKDPTRRLEWSLLRERLLNVRAATERLLQRQEIEHAFNTLDLRLQGILVSERGSQALLNGKLQDRGDCVTLPGEEAGLLIEEIRAKEVICIFRGLRMELKPAFK